MALAGGLNPRVLASRWSLVSAVGQGLYAADIPLGASVSLFMIPLLAVAAVFILRDVNKRAERM